MGAVMVEHRQVIYMSSLYQSHHLISSITEVVTEMKVMIGLRPTCSCVMSLNHITGRVWK